MKLSKETIEILNNFRDINGNLVIHPGNRIRTRSEDNRIYAEAEVPETFEREFGVYDLRSFISAYSILNDPELIFSENDYVVLQEGRTKIKYYFSDSDLLTSIPPNKEVKLGNKDVCLQLPQTQINKLNKMTTFDSERRNWIVEFLGDNQEIYLKVYHKDDPTMTSYSSVVGETSSTFSIKTYLDSFKFINGDYDVVLSSSPVFALEAINPKRSLRYVVPMSPESTYAS